MRVCTNGMLSGSGNYASCSVGTPASCVFNGATVAHGSSVKAYKASAVPSGSTCESENRLCNNGTLQGSYGFSGCSVSQPQVCANGTTNYPSCSVCSAGKLLVDGYCQSCHSGNAEAWYLAGNLDVKNAVLQGAYSSGLQHWCSHGRNEGRSSCFNAASCVVRVCDPGTSASCDIANGTGRKVCNAAGSGYDSCQTISCNSGYALQGGSCVKYSCGDFTMNAKCKVINTCPNGNSISAQMETPLVRISLSGTAGSVVVSNFNHVTALGASDRVIRWDNLAFRCENDSQWAKQGDGNCEISRTLSPDDFRCQGNELGHGPGENGDGSF